MAPHLEVRSQATVGDRGVEIKFGSLWDTVPGTMHKTGDVLSENSIKAHKLLADEPDNYREVPDYNGKLCNEPEKQHIGLFPKINIFHKKG